MFEVDSGNIRTTSLTLLWHLCLHVTYFTPSSSVFIADFKQVNANWDNINLPSSN